MTISIYMDCHCTIDKLKLLGRSSEEVIRCLLETLFHPETVNIYNLKPSPLQKRKWIKSRDCAEQERNEVRRPWITSSNQCVSGLLWWLIGKEPTCECVRHGFAPWVGKIPWRRKWQPTPVFLPGESHGQRSLAGYSPMWRQELEMT